MKKLKDLIGKIISRGPIAVTLSVIASVLFITGIISAATTISTNISTGGTLSVVGQSTLGGQASTTRLSVNETSYFGGSATTTIGIGGNITGGGTLVVYGQSTLGGQASTTRLSVNETAYFGGTATTTFSKTGNITSGTTNSATTTLTIGCIQMYATSTDTAIRLEFGVNHMASTTFRTGGSTAGQANQSGGQVVWVYGSCP